MRHILLIGALALAACSGREVGINPDEPDASSPVTAGDASFHLYVSNQSFDIDPVHIRIAIDGNVVVDEQFEVLSQHNWQYFPLTLAHGPHTLRVESSTSAASFEESFEIDGDRWAVVDFWYYSDSHYDPTDEQFTFSLHDGPIGFD